MSAAIQTLTNAKEALDAQLITKADFDTVKDAFLRAQQLKAGLDAGFILEADYQHVKHAFFESLRIGSAPAATSALNDGSAPLGTRPSGTISEAAPSSAPTSRAPSPPPNPPTSAALPPQGQPSPQQSSAPAPAAQQQDAGSRGLAQQDSFTAPDPPAAAGERFAAPTSIPSSGSARRRQNTGKSIAGIDVTEDAVNLYYYLKAKSTYRWATWKINAEGTKVVIANAGDKQATFADLLSCLPPQDCRYAVFDYQFTNSDGFVLNKIVFISWAPEASRVRIKMMYASTKDFFKGFLDGLSIEVQASGLDDLTEEELRDSVRAATTRG